VSEYMQLLGTENVERAASSMRSAAEEMNRAAATMEAALFEHRRFMEDFIMRLASLPSSSGEARGNGNKI